MFSSNITGHCPVFLYYQYINKAHVPADISLFSETLVHPSIGKDLKDPDTDFRIIGILVNISIGKTFVTMHHDLSLVSYLLTGTSGNFLIPGEWIRPYHWFWQCCRVLA